MFDVSTADPARTKRFLKIVGVLALIDVFTLVPLLLGYLEVIDTDSFVGPLGGTHGTLFLVLAALVAWGAFVAGLWSWRFPATVIGSNLVLFGLLQAIKGDDPPLLLAIPAAILIAIPLTADYLATKELEDGAGRRA
ncbi:unannotated protein [freshwater metagenome]|uniref:Unannotated protein n=1 Tax=freshwater metagenome TaxID=449393 RepID=A0A6J7IMT0_9ZZZZ|nr:hypothetical protein [Actinomycetota bacterium]